MYHSGTTQWFLENTDGYCPACAWTGKLIDANCPREDVITCRKCRAKILRGKLVETFDPFQYVGRSVEAKSCTINGKSWWALTEA